MLFVVCLDRILGLCLLQNELCPITLNRHVIKVLLGRKVCLPPNYCHNFF